MSLLTQALQDINHWIASSESWHAKRIRGHGVRPGLQHEMIKSCSDELNFQFSEEVIELYKWRDGDFWIGDLANPVYFVSLNEAVRRIVELHSHCQRYLPLFIGDEAYWIVPEVPDVQEKSPVFFVDETYLVSTSRLCDGVFSPSLTCLMQAVAECARTHDGISAIYMREERPHQEIFPDLHFGRSVLTPIYEKYGVVGGVSGLWN
jgi:hypothetical protein